MRLNWMVIWAFISVVVGLYYWFFKRKNLMEIPDAAKLPIIIGWSIAALVLVIYLIYYLITGVT